MDDRVPCDCPVEGCSYRTAIRMTGMNGHAYLAIHAARRTALRVEHPYHRPAEEYSEFAPKPIAVGECFPLGVEDLGDCPHELVGDEGLYVFCALDVGHGGPHVATDGQYVVGVWRSTG